MSLFKSILVNQQNTKLIHFLEYGGLFAMPFTKGDGCGTERELGSFVNNVTPLGKNTILPP